MQYNRVFRRFRRQNNESREQEVVKPNAQNVPQMLPNCDSQSKISALEEEVLELQSAKIKLMEQLKSSLQANRQESQSPKQEDVYEMLQVTQIHDQAKDLGPVQHANRDSSSQQHPFFSLHSKGNQHASEKATTLTIVPPVQHPLFPVLPQVEHQKNVNHQLDSKVTLTFFEHNKILT
jgi:hypothetical protein